MTTGSGDYLQVLLKQAEAEEAFLDRIRQTESVEASGIATRPASPSIVSLMITKRQRAELHERGFSDEAIRSMTPAEAHAQLGMAKQSP